ncbi:RNA-directed DNA polymerase [Acidovorax delafieldii]|uniref:reverse transcriptase domain-containing protein n=1 Tax=Acidovorax delafieldii TaxID=47920 RepID=UPI002859F68B|nr:reverse transcriptase domain-containing protein [Acidovorax delafieldii]MDR6153862.1 RNA-directed DNA polymerase [Acidovorax delafieldii]
MELIKGPLIGMVPPPLDDDLLFKLLFSAEALEAVFRERFATTTGKGIDRLNGFQFSARSKAQFAVVSEKIISGRFRFSPYLEVLRPKSRDKKPRLIGIPTVRDRVVLHQLNKFLAAKFPERVPKNVASTYVRELSQGLQSLPKDTTWICSTDIQTFYDDIRQPRLLWLLRKRVSCEAVNKLVGHAIATPTVPKNTGRARHKDYVSKGVPQGLAISNILASIFMQDVDDAMKDAGVTYYRYVDDVLMYGSEEPVRKAFASLKKRLAYRGLKLHSVASGKTHVEPLAKPFGYLGYTFCMPTISVRSSTVEKFLQTIAAKFSDYAHNKAKRLEKFKYLNEERLNSIFLLELNERISGAISEKRRYGWIAYFSQINDLTLLHKLDDAIAGMFSRLPEFGGKPPADLKQLKRAFHEIKYKPLGGYISNYDLIESPAEMLTFLVARGRVSDDELLTDAQIVERFEKYRKKALATMHADEGVLYG